MPTPVQKLSEHIREHGVSPTLLDDNDFYTVLAVADEHGLKNEWLYSRNVDDDVASYAIEMLEAHGL